MKFQLTFKTPDVKDHAIDMDFPNTENWEEDDIQDLLEMKGLKTIEQLEELKEEQKAGVDKACDKWLKWDEYLTVEIDTKADTCIVIPPSE